MQNPFENNPIPHKRYEQDSYKQPEGTVLKSLEQVTETLDILLQRLYPDFQGHEDRDGIATFVLTEEQKESLAPQMSTLTERCLREKLILTQTEQGFTLTLPETKNITS